MRSDYWRSDESLLQRCAMVILILGFIIGEIVVNVKLAPEDKQCKLEKYIDIEVNATLYTNGTWYVFQYKTLRCDALHDESLIGKKTGRVSQSMSHII